MASFSVYGNSLTLNFERSELTDRQMRGLRLLFGKLDVPRWQMEGSGSKSVEGCIVIGKEGDWNTPAHSYKPGISLSVSVSEAYICRPVEGQTVEVNPSEYEVKEGEKLAALTPEEKLAYVEQLIASKTQPKVRPKYECVPAELAAKEQPE
jgi:hypothetical protein